MLLKHSTLAAIANGTVTAAFRYWHRPRVRAGSRFRTALGAGYATRAALLQDLARHRGGHLHRIGLRFAGADPRMELAVQTSLSPPEYEHLRLQLARLGARTDEGPWAMRVLR